MTSRRIADITIGERHRHDFGDIAALAHSIKTEGLLQPIGITAEDELVFGYRRLAACRDILGWTEIDARIVNVTAIVAGEHAENEMRKDFTTSERVAILETIERNKHGGDRRSIDRDHAQDLVLDREEAAKRAGFGNPETARQARVIVDQGIPELVAAVDAREIAIEPGSAIALQPEERQAEIVKMPTPERRAAVRQLPRSRKKQESRVKDLRRCSKCVGDIVGHISTVDGWLLEPEEFFELIEKLAAASEQDFAEKARAAMTQLERDLEPAIARLMAYRDALQGRRGPADG